MKWLSRHEDGRHFPVFKKEKLPRLNVPRRFRIGKQRLRTVIKDVSGVGSHPLIGAEPGTVVVSPQIPRKWRPWVAHHERTEYAGMKERMAEGYTLQEAYDIEHPKADASEIEKFKPTDEEWAKYMDTVERIDIAERGYGYGKCNWAEFRRQAYKIKSRPKSRRRVRGVARRRRS
jgi:hypothetical protein